MFVGGIINGKGKFTTDGNEAASNIHAWNRARVRCIKQEKDSLKGNTDRVALIGRDLQALCKVSVNTFNNHGVVVVT